MQIDKNNIKENEHIIKLTSLGMHEMSAKYSEYIDKQVCQLLREKRIRSRRDKIRHEKATKKITERRKTSRYKNI